MRSAIIYCRVSTSRQAEEGLSLESQRAECEAYAARRKWEVVQVYVEPGASGRTTNNRPMLDAAMRHVCEVKGVLLFYSLSRFARSTRDAIDLSDKIRACGGEIASVTDEINTASAHGAFYFTLLAALARLESDIISERIKAANRHTIATKGHRTQGEAPFGLRFDPITKSRVENPDEMEIVRKVLLVRAKNGGFKRTADRLNELGVPTPGRFRHGEDSKWGSEMVRRIVMRHKG